ncbi:MAG: SDR family oxidoreductase [Thermoflavifilum sp.]|nr:SDR family oxidoreductase [Thermoflavifilum sp.]MBX5439700.1 SDR family oxidoreductase [Thermoflavifilum sp.]
MRMGYIVISGGTRGIGKAIALHFAQQHWHVALCGRNEAALQAVKQEMQTRHPGGMAIVTRVDVTDEEQVHAFANEVQQHFPVIDVLVNNAGIFEPGAVHQEEEGQLERQMASNLYSAYYLTRALLPLMISRRQGHIFNICSTASLQAYANGGSYSISKFALLGFSRNLREELKPYRIKVTALMPGPTLTDSWAGYPAPAERFIPPQDIAMLVWQLCNLSPQTVVEELTIRPMEGDIPADT